MKRTALAAALLVLAACSSGGQPQPTNPGTAEPPPYRPPPSRAEADQCGASALSWLVGRPKSDIPVPVEMSLRRVTCTTCPVTMDYNPRRLNIVFDADSGAIREVKCG